MKTGVQVLVYNQEEYLDFFLKSIYPFVDVIQVMYSDKPFTKYNNESRINFTQTDSSLDILLNFPDFERKIFIQKGEWDDEESMRNNALQLLKEKKVELCLILDADEFWSDGMLPNLILYIKENLEINQVAWCHDKTLFKQLDRLIDFPQSKLPVAFIITDNSEFVNRRIPSGEKVKLPSIYFYWHLGYILPDKRMYEKIMTFSHADEVPDKWFHEKWINFSAKTKNLCRKGSLKWSQTIPNNPWELPSILFNHPFFPYGPNKNGIECKEVHIWHFLNSSNIFQDDNFFKGFEKIIELSCTKQKNKKDYTQNPERGLIIYSLIKSNNLKSYLEIGTSKGYSMLCALKAFTEKDQEFKITTIDIDTEKQVVSRKNMKTVFGKLFNEVEIINGSSKATLNQNRKSSDIIFVDGSHKKEDVLFDGNWAIQNSNQFVLFDDYNPKVWPQVVSACDELMKKYTSGKWYLIVSDRLLYKKERKDDIKVFREGYGILVYEKKISSSYPNKLENND